MHRIQYLLSLCLLLLVACGNTLPSIAPFPPTSEAAIALRSVTNTPPAITLAGTLPPAAKAPILSPTPIAALPTSQAIPTTAAATPTGPIPTAIPAPTVALTAKRFTLNGESRSSRELLANIVLEVRSGDIDTIESTVSLVTAFENRSEEAIDLTGGNINERDWRLIDANGNLFLPLEVDPALLAYKPDGGFAPGGATIGVIRFPLPGAAPWTLEFATTAGYAPMQISPQEPDHYAAWPLVEGAFSLGNELYSAREVLTPLTLRVEQVVISAETLTLDINFVNNSRQGYTIRGIDGSDAWLLDSDGRQLTPIQVSDSMRDTISPEGGWAPGGDHKGSLVFARPTDGRDIRFIFQGYSPLTLQFSEVSLVQSNITSADGGAPPPTPTPRPETLAYDEIEALLAIQSDALLAANVNNWLSTFDASLHGGLTAPIQRTGQMPLSSVELSIAPGGSINDSAGAGIISNLPIQLRFVISELEHNPFTYSASYSLVRGDGGWLVTDIAFTGEAPFWWEGDFVQQSSEHFLLFSSTISAPDFESFEAEVETAWQALRDKGLPIDDRYLAWYTVSQNEFATRAGGSSRQLGIARSRYQVLAGDLTISNRIFYINGESFRDVAIAASNDRQTTITHELLHLVFNNLTRPFTPPWLSEGAAVFYSDDVSAEDRERLLANPIYDTISLETLTSASSLGEHDVGGNRGPAEYIYAGELYSYLVETYGELGTLNFYRSFGEFEGAQLQERMPTVNNPQLLDSIMASIASELTPQLIEQSFGITMVQLEANFRAWLTP